MHIIQPTFPRSGVHDHLIFENSIILVNRGSPQWMTSAALRLARLSAIACSMSIVASRNPKVLLESAVLQLLGHPGLDVLVKFTAENSTLLALSLSYDLPSGLEGIGTNASCVEWHFGTVDSTIDKIEVGRGETEATRVNLVEVAEYFQLELGREAWEGVSVVARRNER
jgi:hypothetical protein